MKPDIQRIANEDPVVAGLLDFKGFFFWADWQLIRNGLSHVLIEKLLKRVKASYHLPWIFLAAQLPVLTRSSRIRPDDTFWEAWGYSISVGSVLLIGVIIFHVVTRKKLRTQVQQLHRLKIMAKRQQ